MGRWNGHKCEFISSLVASFHFQNNKKWQNSRSSALPSLCLQPLLLQHINNTTINLVTDAEHWGELHYGAIGEEKEEEIRGANIKCSMELIGGRWLADAEQHNNQPPN